MKLCTVVIQEAIEWWEKSNGERIFDKFQPCFYQRQHVLDKQTDEHYYIKTAPGIYNEI